MQRSFDRPVRQWHTNEQQDVPRERHVVQQHDAGDDHTESAANVSNLWCASSPLNACVCAAVTSLDQERLVFGWRTGQWTSWVNVTSCSGTCGTGSWAVTRECDWAYPFTDSILSCQPTCNSSQVAAAYGTNAACGTLQSQSAACNLSACPVGKLTTFPLNYY